jgi:glyoxylase-like metal-dependent hydrolase (beta-lactamase superfamily II)
LARCKYSEPRGSFYVAIFKILQEKRIAIEYMYLRPSLDRYSRLNSQKKEVADDMLKKVYPNIYLQEVPLPKNPLKVLNSYLITGKGQNLIIDTGFNNPDCEASLMQGINEAGIDLTETSLLVTHHHSDHCGLAAALQKKGVRVYAGKIEGDLINNMIMKTYWERRSKYITMYDLKKDNVSLDDHPGYKYRPEEPVDYIPIKDGDCINIGNFSFKVVDIPGHTPGQIGLYEKQHRLFFGGDHVLAKITPNITFWGFDNDILNMYFCSLKKVYDLDIKYLFTAHRSIITDHRQRIEELLQHHMRRLQEIEDILAFGEQTVRDVASKMHWDLRYDKWEDFPNAQKWFASGEAMSHLEHLVFTGSAVRVNKDEVLYYYLTIN